MPSHYGKTKGNPRPLPNTIGRKFRPTPTGVRPTGRGKVETDKHIKVIFTNLIFSIGGK